MSKKRRKARCLKDLVETERNIVREMNDGNKKSSRSKSSQGI